jgi:hypothetical protein
VVFLFDSSKRLVHRQYGKFIELKLGAKFKLTHQPSLKTSISSECNSNQNFYHELDEEQDSLQIPIEIYCFSFSHKRMIMFGAV